MIEQRLNAPLRRAASVRSSPFLYCPHVINHAARRPPPQPVTVVGVHSAKFDNEKDSEAIRAAVLRYGVTHPVVNDGEMITWRALGVQSWPTLLVVSPNGQVIASLQASADPSHYPTARPLSLPLYLTNRTAFAPALIADLIAAATARRHF